MLERASVLVVDDEPIVVEVLGRYLRREGFLTTSAASGPEALRAAVDADNPPQVIVLDVMLPGCDGLEVCRRLREEQHLQTPIILLTARGEEADRIGGLLTGADDYVVKPFSPGELVARVKAQLRRLQMQTQAAEAKASGHLRGGEIELDPYNRTVSVRGQPTPLTSKEFDLLHYLMAHAGQLVSREELLDQVWDRDFVGDPGTLSVHVRRLREKIERDPSRPTHVKVVWGLGYKFEPSVSM
jgi:DNA-binding response OmpR family regulator